MEKAHPYRDAFFKVDRARKHFAELKSAISSFIDSDPYRVVIEPDGDRHAWTMRVFGEIPMEISLILGDLIHNLRASLDLCAFQSVEKAGGSTKGVAFPFARNAEELARAIKDRKIAQAGPLVVDFIGSLQPYEGGNRLLKGIHDLDIRDKHHALIPSMVHAGIKNLRAVDEKGCVVMDNVNIRNPVQDGFVLMTMSPAKNIKLGDQLRPVTEITFAKGQPFEDEPLVETIGDLIDTVQVIIETFPIPRC